MSGMQCGWYLTAPDRPAKAWLADRIDWFAEISAPGAKPDATQSW
jgi:hypothetical protein